MKPKIIFISIIFLIFASCSNKTNSEELTCLQIIDRNGLSETISSKEELNKYKNYDFNKNQPYQKVLRIYDTNDSKSYLTSYHPNGELYKYLEIKDSRAFGKYMEYYPNGTLKVLATIIGGPSDFEANDQWIFDGVCKVFSENQSLLSKFNYSKGSLEGDSIYYHPNSKVKKIIPYVNNLINGEVKEYRDDESLLSKKTYKNGIKNDNSTGYWDKDNIAYIEDYVDGKLQSAQYFSKSRIKVASIKNGDGQKAVFNKNKLSTLLEYKNGYQNGLVQNFNENSELTSEYFLNNNEKEGVETIYFLKNELPSNLKNKSKVPKMQITWDNSTIHGQVKTWYKNNQIESQKEYSRNKKNGLHTAFYENGSVMFIEEYENDLLIKASYFKKDQTNPISDITNGNGIATIFDKNGIFLKKITYKDGSLLHE
jgi:antitoxin component YwqK of YwqJK toxin-antitoxin module